MVEQLKSDRKQVETERARVESEKDKLTEKQEQFDLDKQRFEKKISQLKSERQQLDAEKARVESEKDKLTAKQEQFESDKRQFENRVKGLNSEIKRLKSERDKLASEMLAIETKRSKTIKTKPIQSHNKNITHLRSKPDTLSDDDITATIKKFNFYDKYRNKSGQFENAYKDNHDGTVTDGKTSLMWQQGGSDKYMPMEDIYAYIDQLNKQKYAGYSDWRLPTVEELMSLMENKEMNGDLYIDPVFSNKQRWCWTSDKRSSSSSWVVNFDDGNVDWHINANNYVRSDNDGRFDHLGNLII
jgi:chromosome segregation ATPase